MALGAEIKKARIDRGLKARELAEKVEIEPQYMSQMENDKAPGLTQRVFIRICDVLGVSCDQLSERRRFLQARKSEEVFWLGDKP